MAKSFRGAPPHPRGVRFASVCLPRPRSWRRPPFLSWRAPPVGPDPGRGRRRRSQQRVLDVRRRRRNLRFRRRRLPGSGRQPGSRHRRDGRRLRRATATGWPTTTATCSPPVTPGSSAAGPPARTTSRAFAARPQGDGYWMATRTGTVENYGAAPPSRHTGETVARASPTLGRDRHRGGAWMAGIDGGVFTFGDATFFGSMGGKRLNQPIVGLAPTVTGRGYWLVASDGGIFSFGDASFFGSMGGTPLVAPVVGMAATPTGAGYWMVASDGGIFAFGDAKFFGSMGGTPLNAPVRGMLARPGSPDQVIEPAHTSPPGPPGTPAPPGTPGTTLPPPGRHPVATLVGAGDIASCGNDTDEADRPPARRRSPEPVDRGVDRRRQRLQQRHGRRSSTTATDRRGAATRTAPGRRPATTTTTRRPRWATTATSARPPATPGKGWYSYDIGAWHVIVLNGNCSAVGGCQDGSVAGAVARADLAASQARCTVAICAPPPVQLRQQPRQQRRGSPRCGTPSTPGRADVVLNGHEHVYERFAPQRPDQARDDSRRASASSPSGRAAPASTPSPARRNPTARPATRPPTAS